MQSIDYNVSVYITYVVIGGFLVSFSYKLQYKSDGKILVLCKIVYIVVTVLVATTWGWP